jgi:hypothetical protein
MYGSSVSIEILDDCDSISGRSIDGIVFLHHHVQTSYGAHPASYPMDTEDFYPWDKAAMA